MFFINQESIYIVLIVYIDDILLTRNDEEKIKEIKTFKEYIIEDLGAADMFLGIKIEQTIEGLMIS